MAIASQISCRSPEHRYARTIHASGCTESRSVTPASPPAKASSTSLHAVAAEDPIPVFKFVEEAIHVDRHLKDITEEFTMPDPIQGMRNLLFDTC